jgi:putative ABC transport system ATP-binding protein
VARLEAHEIYRFFHNGDTETVALRGINLALEAGELVVLIGPSGSGKSTLLACLAGLDDPDGGTVLVEGERLSRQPKRVGAALRARRFGILMQSGNLFEHLSVMDNIRLQQRLAGVKLGTSDWPDRLGIGDRRSALPSELSGGEAARAGLAVALAGGADILICDEPTAEVDSATEEAMLDVLKGRRDDGAAVLIATHSRTLAAAADRTLSIADGRLQ